MHHSLCSAVLLVSLLFSSTMSIFPVMANTTQPDILQADIPFKSSAALEHSMDSKTCEIIHLYANSEEPSHDRLLATVWYDLQNSSSPQAYESLSYWPVLYLSLNGKQHALSLQSVPFNVRESNLSMVKLQWADEYVHATLQLDTAQRFTVDFDGTPRPLQTNTTNISPATEIFWHGRLTLKTGTNSTTYTTLVISSCAP